MLTGANIDDRPLMNANILKFFEKSFGSSGLSRIFEMSKGNKPIKIRSYESKKLQREWIYTCISRKY